MRYIDPPRRTDRALTDAVKLLRSQLGDSQQSFANRLGLSIRAIANYEKDRKPTAMALARLAKASQDAGRGDLAYLFMNELAHELGLQHMKCGLFSQNLVSKSGFMLIPFDGSEPSGAAKALFDTMTMFHAGDPTEKAKARESLAKFAKEVTKA